MSQLYILLGRQVARFREQADLTQEELAEKTDYSVDFISLVERGVNAPTLNRLKDIADVLGVEVWQLFKPLDHGPDAPGPGARRKAAKRRRAKPGR